MKYEVDGASLYLLGLCKPRSGRSLVLRLNGESGLNLLSFYPPLGAALQSHSMLTPPQKVEEADSPGATKSKSPEKTIGRGILLRKSFNFSSSSREGRFSTCTGVSRAELWMRAEVQLEQIVATKISTAAARCPLKSFSGQRQERQTDTHLHSTPSGDGGSGSGPFITFTGHQL